MRDEFKEDIRHRFRKHFIGLLNGKYEFFKFNINSDEMEDFVSRNFRELIGKIFHFNDTLILALEKGHEDTAKIKSKYSDILIDDTLS